ncbi:MAG: ABC transporter permease subunit [Neglectibacter timonensis]
MGQMLSQFPKPVLAMFGMAEARIETLGGFYAVLQFYAMILLACYAVHLGTASVLRESMDKTYEFLFTKPCGRMHILSMKLLGGLLFLGAMCLLNGLFSWIAPGLYGIRNTIQREILLFSAAVFWVGLLFFSMGAWISVVMKRGERAVQVAYGTVLLSYGLSVAFDMDERLECLRPVTLFRYFRAGELLEGHLHAGYLISLLLFSALFLALAYLGFRRKDLNAA